MPAISGANLARLRTKQHKTKLYLAVYHPASMWTAQVNGNHAAYATAIAVSGASGTTPVADYEVWFGSSAGLMDIGRSRVKSFSGSTLTIAPNNMDLAGGEYITVKQNIIPASIQPNCGTTIYENWDTAYTDQNTNYRPIARMGAPACAFIGETTGLATVKFWSDSEAISGTLSSYLWVTPNGTYTTGNATTAGTAGTPNVVTWDTAGQYWCSLRVTDSNGNTHTTYRPVFIFNRYSGTVPYSQIEIQGLEGSQESGGWTCALTVRGTADRTAFPELAQVVIFAEDYYDDELTSIGGDYTWRENIVFVGFVQEGSVKAHAWNQTIELKADGIGVLMEKLPGYAANLVSGTPGGWHTLTGMTYKLAAYHIITEHSTIDHICDVDLSPISASASRIDFVASSLKDQIAMQCIAPIRSVLGSSRLGRLYARQQPQLVAAASRTESITLDTSNADFRDTIDIISERELKPVAQIDFNGYKFVDGEQTPVLSLAPGVPWDSGRFERVDGIYVDTQANSNIISGYFEGRANNQYPEVSIKWRGNYRIFDPFPVEKIRLNLTTAQNNRGIAWTNKIFWTKRMSMSYRAGILLVDTSVESDVVGNPGITGNYPVNPPTPPTPVPPGTIDEPTITPPPPRPQGRGNLIYVCGTNAGGANTGGIAKCVDGYSGTPVWSVVAGGPSHINGLTSDAQNVKAINFDPFSYNGTMFTKMWAMTGDGLYLGVTLDGTPSFSKKLDSTSAGALLGKTVTLGLSFTPNVRTSGMILALAHEQNGAETKTYTLWSLDNGTTWNGNALYWIRGLWASVGTGNELQIICSYHKDSTYYIAGQMYGTESEPFTTYMAVKATTLPVFTKHYYIQDAHNDPAYATIVQPFINQSGGNVYTNDDRIYVYGVVYSDGVTMLRKFTSFDSSDPNAPALWSGIGDVGMVWGFSNPKPPYYFFPHTFDENYIIGAHNTSNELWTTFNNGAIWTKYAVAMSGRTGVAGGGVANLYLVPADENIFYLLTHDTNGLMCIGKTIDFGATFTDISNFGTANAIDTVLGTSTNAGQIILVDYYKV